MAGIVDRKDSELKQDKHSELGGGTVDQNSDTVSISPEKLEANRRNAQLSTGPRTEQGKSRSRRNAIKHGILSSALLISKGEGAEDPAEFDELLGALSRDLAPVGALEEILVHKIAKCCWRERRAQRCEAGVVRRAFLPDPRYLLREALNHIGTKPNPQREAIKDHLSLPLGPELDRILRYETNIHRQLAYAINQLERLQRARKGEYVPAPVNVQVSRDEIKSSAE